MSLYLLGVILVMSQCTNPDTIVDKKSLLGNDYRLFQNTPAWNLAKAVDKNDVEEIKLISSKNPSLLNYQDPIYGQTLLQLAVYNEQYKVAKGLLDNGADPNISDKDYGNTPIMEAAKIGYGSNHSDTRFLKLLLERGANPNFVQNIPRKTRNTPLMSACETGNMEYIKILIAGGAKVDFVNEYGESALSEAAISVSLNKDPEIVLYLINNGADVHRALYVTIPEGKKKYLTDVMRMWRFDIGSHKYKVKMDIVKYLQERGMDYWKAPVPKEYAGDYSKAYLDHY